jgi:hypothetical protein
MSDTTIRRVLQVGFFIAGFMILASVDPRISAGVIAVTIAILLNDG